MNMLSIIEAKKQGKSLTPDQIRWFIEGYTRGDIPDYQASALPTVPEPPLWTHRYKPRASGKRTG